MNRFRAKLGCSPRLAAPAGFRTTAAVAPTPQARLALSGPFPPSSGHGTGTSAALPLGLPPAGPFYSVGGLIAPPCLAAPRSLSGREQTATVASFHLSASLLCMLASFSSVHSHHVFIDAQNFVRFSFVHIFFGGSPRAVRPRPPGCAAVPCTADGPVRSARPVCSPSDGDGESFERLPRLPRRPTRSRGGVPSYLSAPLPPLSPFPSGLVRGSDRHATPSPYPGQNTAVPVTSGNPCGWRPAGRVGTARGLF